jgi:TPR repeat protein
MKKCTYKYRIISSFLAMFLLAGHALAMKPKHLPEDPAPAPVPPSGLKTKAEIQFGLAAKLWSRYDAEHNAADLRKARELYESAANAGIVHAMWHLGQLYVQHSELVGLDSDPTSLILALKLFSQAALRGHTTAEYFMGIHRASTQEKAAAGDLEAQYIMVHFYTPGTPEQRLIATFNLGRAYLTGTGLKQDLKRAQKFLRIAAEAGNPIAIYLVARYFPTFPFQRDDLRTATFGLGVAFLHGEGVRANIETAKAYFEDAANLGNLRVLARLGDIYIQAGDYESAAAYYIRAIEAGCLEAFLKLGRLYAQGLGVRRNMEEAIRLFEQAVEGKVRNAQEELDRTRADLAAEDTLQTTIDLGLAQAPALGLGFETRF